MPQATVYLSPDEAEFVASQPKDFIRKLIRREMGGSPDVRSVPQYPDYRPKGLKR